MGETIFFLLEKAKQVIFAFLIENLYIFLKKELKRKINYEIQKNNFFIYFLKDSESNIFREFLQKKQFMF